MPDSIFVDVLIIGAGVSGLTTALHLDTKLKIAVVSKTATSSSIYAQGGIAAVTERVFTTRLQSAREAHMADTMATGYGLCRKNIVSMVIDESNEAIENLLALKIPFSKKNSDEYHLGLEGGHSERRIWHVADHTGKSIIEVLRGHIAACTNIQLMHGLQMTRILQQDEGVACGAHFIDSQGNCTTVYANYTVLATGGASGVYKFNSANNQASGDGISAAYEVGCNIVNMEFTQFHPTFLYNDAIGKGFLISEALRGEGALLLDETGQPFLHKYGSQELMTRDKCSIAIYLQLQKQQKKHVFLDARMHSESFLRFHFPSIYNHCLSVGIDIASDLVPVIPVSHYTCGGVDVDEHGATSVKGLYAVGEVAHTGLHGANRLASNSLLECLVFAKRVAISITNSSMQKIKPVNMKEGLNSGPYDNEVWQALQNKLQQKMWTNVGIVRTDKGLAEIKNYIIDQLERYEQVISKSHCLDAVSFGFILRVADLITTSAQNRLETRGLHIMQNHKETAQTAQFTFLNKVV